MPQQPLKSQSLKELGLKLVLLFLIVLALNPIVNAKSLSVSPSAVSIEYTLGDSQPADKSISFTNSDNASFSIALTKNGSGTSLYNISASTLGFNGSESKAITMTFGISSDTIPNLYSSKIWYGTGDEFIPVFITVKAKSTTTTGCKLLLPSELFSRSIKKGTNPFTQDFLLQISSKCTNGLTITDIRESGQVTVTEQGLQPIRLTGLIPKGSFEKGQTTVMNVEFDVSELQLGDYRSSVVITSTEGDEQLTQKMDFRIFVVGTASAVGNDTFSALPTCSLSTADLQVGKTYQIVCNNVVDTNIQLKIDTNSLEYIKGLSSEYPSGQIIWRFTPIKLGNTKLITYLSDSKGLPIGEVQKYDLRISQVATGELGTKLKFDFFPKTLDIDSLKAGDEFSVLIKAVNPDVANDTGTIIDNAVLYRDGVATDERKFTSVAGQSFTLSASAIGFGSIEKTISVPLQKVSVGYSPTDIEVGRNITFSTTPSEAILLLNGIEIQKTYVFSEAGVNSLTARSANFEDNTFSITVTEQLRALSDIPEDIKKGDDVVIEFNKPVEWNVVLRENNETSTLFAQGSDKVVSFTPDRKGVYELYVRDNLFSVWDLTGFTFSWTWFFIIAVAIILLYLASKYEWFKFRGNKIVRAEKTARAGFDMEIPKGEQ